MKLMMDPTTRENTALTHHVDEERRRPQGSRIFVTGDHGAAVRDCLTAWQRQLCASPLRAITFKCHVRHGWKDTSGNHKTTDVCTDVITLSIATSADVRSSRNPPFNRRETGPTSFKRHQRYALGKIEDNARTPVRYPRAPTCDFSPQSYSLGFFALIDCVSLSADRHI